MSADVQILVVEDEELILETVQDALLDGGFDVITATTGQAALARLETHQATLRALVTDIDLSVADISGWHIARRARELNAELPVVYMSGASAHLWNVYGVPNSIMLSKPFVAAQMVTAVSQLLNTLPPI